MKTDLIKELDELSLKRLNTNFSTLSMNIATLISLILVLKGVLTGDELDDLIAFSTEEINKNKFKTFNM